MEWPPPRCWQKRLAQRRAAPREGARRHRRNRAELGGDVVRRSRCARGASGLERRAAIGDRAAAARSRPSTSARRILGEVAAVGHHHRDRLADVARLRRRRGNRASSGCLIAGCGTSSGIVGCCDAVRQVGEGEDRMHAGQRARRACVDAPNSRMRMRAAHERRVEHAGQMRCRRRSGLAAQQRRVFLALRRARRSISRPSCSSCSCARVRGGERGLDDALVAGAAAEIAGDRVAHLVPRSGAGCRAGTRSASSACRACRSRIAGRAAPGTPAAAG